MVAEGLFSLGFSRSFHPFLSSRCGPSKPQRPANLRLSVCSARMSFEGEFITPMLPERKNGAGDESSAETLRRTEGTDAQDEVSRSQKSRTLSTEKKVLLKNKHGETLVGLLHETGSKELVILCHGFRSSKESRTLLKLAEAFEGEETAVFRFDFSGNGESGGSFQYGNYWKEVEDLRAVIVHFSRRGWKTKAIIGHSKGGKVVLLYASVYDDVPKVVNVSGRFALEKGIEERLGTDYIGRIKREGFIDVTDESGVPMYRVTEESLVDRLSTDMQSACSMISNHCKVFTVHGSKDEIVPVESASQFADLIPNHKLRVLDGADHRYSAHYSELISCVLEFIRE